ncbi:hypothetical protein ACFL1T_04730 [Chlamydiota bacterium]
MKEKEEEIVRGAVRRALVVKKKQEEEGLESLLEDIKIVAEAEGIEVQTIGINVLFGEVQIYSGMGKSYPVELSEASERIISQVLGRVGDSELVIVDSTEEKSVEKLVLEGIKKILDTDKERATEGIIGEEIEIGGIGVIRITDGVRIGGGKIKERLVESVEYFRSGIEKSTYPVLISGELLGGMSEGELREWIEKYGKYIAMPEDEVGKLGGLEEDERNMLKDNWERFKNRNKDHRMAILGRGEELPEGITAGKIKMEKASIEGLGQLLGIAIQIAAIGVSTAKKDEELNRHLREILRELFDGNEAFKELLADEGMVLEKILDNPEKYIFPPIRIDKVKEIESYIRAKRLVEIMA